MTAFLCPLATPRIGARHADLFVRGVRGGVQEYKGIYGHTVAVPLRGRPAGR